MNSWLTISASLELTQINSNEKAVKSNCVDSFDEKAKRALNFAKKYDL